MLLYWFNVRASDGCLCMIEAMTCIDIHNEISKHPFWRREKTWREKYEQQVLDEIINPINALIEESEKENV